MTLSPEVGALLRQALVDAEESGSSAGAYYVLYTAIENLLEPLAEAPDQGQPADLFAPYLASKDEKDLPW